MTALERNKLKMGNSQKEYMKRGNSGNEKSEKTFRKRIQLKKDNYEKAKSYKGQYGKGQIWKMAILERKQLNKDNS